MNLSNEEYNGIPFSLQDAIQAHVNLEEKKWYVAEVIELPKYEKPKKIKWSVGLWNLARQIMP